MVWFYFYLHVSVDQWLNNCHRRNFKQLIFLFTILNCWSPVLLFKLQTFYSDKCIAQVYKQYVSVMMLYKITKMCAKGFVYHLWNLSLYAIQGVWCGYFFLRIANDTTWINIYTVIKLLLQLDNIPNVYITIAGSLIVKVSFSHWHMKKSVDIECSCVVFFISLFCTIIKFGSIVCYTCHAEIIGTFLAYLW